MRPDKFLKTRKNLLYDQTTDSRLKFKLKYRSFAIINYNMELQISILLTPTEENELEIETESLKNGQLPGRDGSRAEDIKK